jgi:hypothetical protein
MDGDERVGEALGRYLDDNGFDERDYGADRFSVRLFGRDLRLPNSAARRRAIPLHDLHHVATGYGTDLAGEAEIGAWELAAGCDSPFLYLINGAAVAIGLCIAPRRVLAAARRGWRARSLYRGVVDAERAKAMTVAELRRWLHLDDGL